MMRKNLKFFIGGAVVLALVGYLAFTGFSKTTAYYLTVDEVLSKRDSIIGKNIRMEGLVQSGTIRWDAANVNLGFWVVGQNSGRNPASMNRINIVYTA
jgi:cytochrome c-type biogenesis protein CcmE